MGIYRREFDYRARRPSITNSKSEAAEDSSLDLSVWGYAPSDLGASLLVHDGIESEDAACLLMSYGQESQDVEMTLQVHGTGATDAVFDFEAIVPLVLTDLSTWLYVTDGIECDDAAMGLVVVKDIPSFRAVVAQRLQSVVSEVT